MATSEEQLLLQGMLAETQKQTKILEEIRAKLEEVLKNQQLVASRTLRREGP